MCKNEEEEESENENGKREREIRENIERLRRDERIERRDKRQETDRQKHATTRPHPSFRPDTRVPVGFPQVILPVMLLYGVASAGKQVMVLIYGAADGDA